MKNKTPNFLNDINVPEDIDLPEEILAIYRKNNKPEENSEPNYEKLATLTSEGWVPPVDIAIALEIKNSGENENDIQELSVYALTESNRIAKDPIEFENSIDDEEAVKPKVIDQPLRPDYFTDIKYYIPEGLSTNQLSKYFWRSTRSAVTYCKQLQNKESTPPNVNSAMQSLYDVKQEVAKEAIQLAIKNGHIKEQNGIIELV